jgi:FkbH-like protein
MENLKYSEILKQNATLAKQVEGLTQYKINILSNVTCNQLQDILEFNLRKSNINPVVTSGNYDNIIQDSFNCGDVQLVVIHYDIVNIIDKCDIFIENYTDNQIDSLYETISSEIDLIIANLKLVPAVLFNTFSSFGVCKNALIPSKIDLLVKRVNEYIYSKKETNLHILDINAIIARVGLFNSFDFRMYYLSKSLYTISFWKEYVYELSTLVYRFNGKLKKAIIFDCDNTLWKGILGEDGICGIDMSAQTKVGQIYNKVQQIAVWLSNQGVIIGLCSKNNAEDVDKVLAEHDDLKLKNENIVVSKINWSDKASNLREISQELNIGLDSLVFIDDSSFEVNLIKEQIPEILTMQVPVAIHEYPSRLLKLIERHFYLSGNLHDIEKTNQYKAQSQRIEELNKHQSLEDYLATIKIEIEIRTNDVTQIDRIAQLTQKTNQFNLTTKRYTENQIELFMNSENDRVFSISVKDKFGESGLTAVCIAHLNENIVSIDSFLMSCRIMGRKIEYAIMNYVIEACKRSGYQMIEAAYYSTNKNMPVSNFYNEFGFSEVNKDEDCKHYQLKISDYIPYNVEFINIKK